MSLGNHHDKLKHVGHCVGKPPFLTCKLAEVNGSFQPERWRLNKALIVLRFL